MREGLAYVLLGATIVRDARRQLGVAHCVGKGVTLKAVEARTMSRRRHPPEPPKYLRALQGSLVMAIFIIISGVVTSERDGFFRGEGI